jgi:hypothetical protein
MKINILNSQKYYLLSTVLLIVLISITFLFAQSDDWLGNGYQYMSNRADDLHIKKGGRVVVESTIIDFDVISNYVAGLRLPVQKLECDGGAGYKLKLVNSKEYFILYTDTGDVFNYSSEKIFESKLESLSIKNKVSLDYSNFEKVWDQYSKYYMNIDYSTCNKMDD